MSTAPHPQLSVAEYLAIERSSMVRSEFYRGQMFAMGGASRRHNGNHSRELGGRP